ncbi:MAG: hypothetical protein DRI90_07100 [Deltaproteobacteria bacterium]|nr:MAG: hypothetical protein DRI90_07100 [Deltaproteobacteria bacterium]
MLRSSLIPLLCIPVILLAAAGCGPEPRLPEPVPAPPPTPSQAVPTSLRYDQVPREELNRLAAKLALPLFWVSDANRDGAIDGSEMAVLWGVANTARAHWFQGSQPTRAFQEAYRQMVTLKTKGPSFDGLDAAEVQRRKLIMKELDQGQPTLVRTRFVNASVQDLTILDNLLAAAKLIERIHAKQLGSYELLARLPFDDPASRMVFYRNQGPWCVAPATESDGRCSAIPGMPPKLSGLYPPSLQTKKDFCELLKKHPNADKLRHQFHVVRGEGQNLRAVPYHEEYGEEMKAISTKLRAAAKAISGSDEQAFKTYLLTAAQAFLDDQWEVADEAWAAMHAGNSKWYLRIGPDEVYFEPCNLKAGFHVSFALVNPGSRVWQTKLEPVKGDMEEALAKLAGPPYRARKVSFRFADFIDIVINAGGSRNALGATVGQSLPNWGPVANEGRGRTVAMTNLYTDDDSRRSRKAQAASMLCADTMKLFEADRDPMVLSVLLHEAAHNLGPAHEYKVGGKKDRDVFGGPLATMLEELKAQTAALYLADWLLARKLITKDQADRAHVADVVWALAQMSRGMVTSAGRPRPYSQLSAIQVGFLLKHGALEWREADRAANGQDQGCMRLHLDKLSTQVATLMGQVARIKARGDKRGAQALQAEHVSADGPVKKLHETIAERWRRAPKQSFVYSIER